MNILFHTTNIQKSFIKNQQKMTVNDLECIHNVSRLVSLSNNLPILVYKIKFFYVTQ